MDNAQVMPDTSILSGEDSLGVVSMRSTDSGGGGYVDHTPSIVQNDSGSQSLASSHAPLSPQRSSHTHNSMARSPASTNIGTPLPMSPIRVTHATPGSAVGAGKSDISMSNFSVPSLDYTSSMLLGVEQLERQQVEMEQRQRHTPARNSHSSAPQNSGSYDDGDEHTEPSSTVTGSTRENPAGRGDVSDPDPATSTFGRLIQSTRRRLSSGDRNRTSSADEDDMLQGALIYGCLQKLGRNGKWQSRWFETDGECLTYYKSQKRLKLLATLDLAKVGSIVINHDDPKGTSFTINISERPYLLRAESKAACKDWVITLNRVKEARMHQGNVKLIVPSSGAHSHALDLLDHDVGNKPRVVVVANRQRTRAVDEENMQSWETVIWEDTNPAVQSAVGQRYRPPSSPHYADVAPPSSSRLAHWQKPRTSISRIANNLLRWARSLRKYGCADSENDVILDHHVHPPGHDDKPKRLTTTSPPGTGKNGQGEIWIGKEAAALERAGPSVSVQELHSDSISKSASAVTSHSHDEEEPETRELS